MFKSTQQHIYQKIDETISWQRMPYLIVTTVIFVVCIYAYILLKNTVSDNQYERVMVISQQTQYPLTQRLANQLLQQPRIDQGAYLQLIRAYETEHKTIKNYPALDPNQ